MSCTLGPISSAGRTAEPFCPSEIRFIPFFSHLYIYGALWGPSVLPAERQNRSALQKFVLPAEPFCLLVLPAERQNRPAHQFCWQNGRTVLPISSASRMAEPFCPCFALQNGYFKQNCSATQISSASQILFLWQNCSFWQNGSALQSKQQQLPVHSVDCVPV